MSDFGDHEYFSDDEGYESDPVDEGLLAEREVIMAEHISDLDYYLNLELAPERNPGRPTPAGAIDTRPLVPLGTIYERTYPPARFNPGRPTPADAIETRPLVPLTTIYERTNPPARFNRGRPTPADAIETRPLVPLATIYERTNPPAGFNPGNGARRAERVLRAVPADEENPDDPTPADAIPTRPLGFGPEDGVSLAALMNMRRELYNTPAGAVPTRPPVEPLGITNQETNPAARFGSEDEAIDADRAAIVPGIIGTLDNWSVGPELPMLADPVSTGPLVPLGTIDQEQLDSIRVAFSDMGSGDERAGGDGEELPQYDSFSDEDIHLGLNESEGSDANARASFPCPFCYVDIEVQVLCSHLEDEHCFNLKDAVCPCCAANLGKDVTGHFIAQHANSFKRRRISDKTPTNGRTNIPAEPVTDPLLLPFISSVPDSDSKASQEDNSLKETSPETERTLSPQQFGGVP